MILTDNLYKAAKAVVAIWGTSKSLVIYELDKAITAYEQEQASSRNQENGQVKTKEEIIIDVFDSQGYDESIMESMQPQIESCMQLYSDQQTFHLKAENKILKQRVSDLKRN